MKWDEINKSYEMTMYALGGNMNQLSEVEGMAVLKTEDIEISVIPYFETFSEQEDGTPMYFFVYNITVKNFRLDAVKLIRRFWYISDGQSNTRVVQGSGVVGKQPWITSGSQFRYSSFCNLPTPVGTMEGKYTFQIESTGNYLEIPVPCFLLHAPNSLN